MPCPLTNTGDGCHWCGGPFTGRRWKWCSDQCEQAWRNNHWWNAARPAALKRDQWTCVRCGHIGWTDIPASVLPLQTDDHELHPHGPRLEHWAIAVGLLENTQDDLWSFAYPQSARRVKAAIDQLPESIHRLVATEQRPLYWQTTRGRRHSTHELEVNHITPREGGGYNSGCHHHQTNLETLCRPCHVDETNRQRRGLPSWRQDPTPIGILMGQLPLDVN